MNDEKQVLVDENEKLSNENNQFREIFSVPLSPYYPSKQNLHLFGIDPNQLNQDGEEQDQEGKTHDNNLIDGAEIMEENEDTNDTS